MIDTLVFNFGGVLVDLQPKVSLRRFRKLGAQGTNEMLNPYRQLGAFHDLGIGLVGRKGLVTRLNEHTGTVLTGGEINEAIMLFLREVFQYKFDYLEQLRKQYKIYILSNTDPYIMAYAHSPYLLLTTGWTLSDYVDKVCVSYNMHIMKPDRAIYEQTITDSGMVPRRMLFIDDSTANLEAVSVPGLQTLLAVDDMGQYPALVARLQ